MSDQNPDPDPRRTPGLEPGGQVPAGETPPAEGSTSGAGPEEKHNPAKGWSRGPVTVMAVLAALVAVFVVCFIAWAILR